MSNPWSQINTPTTEYLARKVVEAEKWQFFWAKDTSSHFLLIFKTEITIDNVRYPSIDGIEITSRKTSDNSFSVILTLQEKIHTEMFTSLCLDIVRECEAIDDERAIPSVISNRLRMWQSLLKRGKTGLLSIEQQRGLIAELHVLGLLMASSLGEEAALKAWFGPDMATHDFVFGDRAIEVKARTSRSNDVMISSEHQLTHGGELYLFTLVVDNSSQSTHALSMKETVDNTRESVTEGFLNLFDQKLFQAGYINREEYSQTYFSTGEGCFYRIEGDFPRLTKESLPPHISKVKYLLDLNHFETWRVKWSKVVAV